ncbi:MAG TPA: dienelactone hydrolase family protein [Saprospiraceae bacterium]|nr:dienelactone hydrolase family protein [Saprospiraceae bacterium]
MKNCLPLLLFALLLAACRQPNRIPMCHDPNAAIEDFAAFAKDPDFRAAHATPVPTDSVFRGKIVTFPVDGGPKGRAYFVKSKKKTHKYLLMIHEWWGLNPNTKKEADMWSEELGINVLAIDLYDGKVTANPEEAGKLMQANDRNRSAAIILGAARHAGKKADFRTIGWCFGGGWSLQASLLLKDRSKACVMYYGMPEKDISKLKMLSPDVLFIHASKDKWITDEVVATFEQDMKSAGKSLSVRRYDADHAFANPSGPRYHGPSAKASRAEVKAFLMGK